MTSRTGANPIHPHRLRGASTGTGRSVMVGMADGASVRGSGPDLNFSGNDSGQMSIRAGSVRVAGEPARDHEEAQAMKQYLISMYQPDGGAPPPEFLAKVMAEIDAMRSELQEAGS